MAGELNSLGLIHTGENTEPTRMGELVYPKTC